MKTPQFTRNRLLSHLRIPAAVTLIAAAAFSAIASFKADPERRLTNDDMTNGGYISDYTLVTTKPYTDAVLTACSQSHGRQNEPAVAVDPRNPDVIVGSYDPEGTLRWKKSFGTTSDESGKSLTLLPNGDVLVAGTANSSLNFGGKDGGLPLP